LISTPLLLPLAAFERIKVISFGKGSLLLREKSVGDFLSLGLILRGIKLTKESRIFTLGCAGCACAEEHNFGSPFN